MDDHLLCRPIPEAQDVFNAFPPAHAEDLETVLRRLHARRGRLLERRTEPSLQSLSASLPRREGASNMTAFILEAPELYWVQCQRGQGVAPQDAVIARDFAEGSSMLVVLERADPAARTAVTIHWPWQNVLAGEAQYSQIMHTCFGNLAELGFDAPQPMPPLAVGECHPQARPLPSSLRLPENKPVLFALNVASQQMFFCVEALHLPVYGDCTGCGRQLAHVHLLRSKVQVRMTAGVRYGPLPL
jgi:hypothetical protein